MRATRSGIVIGLALALLVPMNVVGQESSPPAEAPTGFLALEDASGDLYDTFTDEPIDGPAYADITAMDVMVDAQDLMVQFEVADTVPAMLDSTYTTVGYLLLIDTDGDGSPNYHVDIGSEGGWHINFVDYGAGPSTQLDDVTVVDNTLTATVPLTEFGTPSEMRFRGQMEGLDTPDPEDPLGYVGWGDRVPDEEDAWLALGEPAATRSAKLSPSPEVDAVAMQPSPQPVPSATPKLKMKNLKAITKGKPPKVAFSRMTKETKRYFGNNPEAAQTLSIFTGYDTTEKLLSACKKDPWACRSLVTGLAFIHAQTRDPEAYDLAKRAYATGYHSKLLNDCHIAKQGRCLVDDRSFWADAVKEEIRRMPKDYPWVFE